MLSCPPSIPRTTDERDTLPLTYAPEVQTRSDPHPIRRRFWRFGITLAVAIVIVITGVLVRGYRSGKLVFGHDLLPSYTAGALVRQGRPRAMYDRQAVESFERETVTSARLDMDPRYGPWLNPPFYAWVFVPLAGLPYREALCVFVGINLLLLAASLLLLRRMLQSGVSVGSALADGGSPKCRRTSAKADPTKRLTSVLTSALSTTSRPAYSLSVLLLAISMPAMQAFGHQQNTFISLLLLCGTVTLWQRGLAFPAGLVAGLLFFKPQLAVLVSVALVLTLGWRALAGVGLTGLLLLVVTLFTMPGCLDEFLHRMPVTVHWLQQEAPYHWGRQVTFQSFWRLLIQGHEPGETLPVVRGLAWACSGGFALAMGWVILRYLGRKNAKREDVNGTHSLRVTSLHSTALDRLISAGIVAMPLVMPYYMDYDLTLLVVPAVLFAKEWLALPESIGRLDRWLLYSWIALFEVTYFNPGLAHVTRLNLTVPALALVAVLSMMRCFAHWESGSKPSKT